MAMQIVLAKTEDTMEPVPGKWTTSRGDGINAVAVMATKRIAKAIMWIRAGTEADQRKAETFAAAEGYVVLAFPTSERNPLELAKQIVLTR